MPIITSDYTTGYPEDVFYILNRKISAYKAHYSYLKIGITGQSPQARFGQHLKKCYWGKMVLLYRTSSERYANIIEEWLVDKHWNDVTNQRQGGGSYLAKSKYYYVYLLLEK